MSSTQPGSPTPPPSASLEERIRERVERRGSEMEGRRSSRENTGLFFLSFFFFFTPPLLVPGCQAATMLSWPFFRSIGNSVGSSHGGRRGEGNGFGQGEEEEEGERERERERGGGGGGREREQGGREGGKEQRGNKGIKCIFQHEHMGDENTHGSDDDGDNCGFHN